MSAIQVLIDSRCKMCRLETSRGLKDIQLKIVCTAMIRNVLKSAENVLKKEQIQQKQYRPTSVLHSKQEKWKMT